MWHITDIIIVFPDVACTVTACHHTTTQYEVDRLQTVSDFEVPSAELTNEGVLCARILA
jgi:hypothetical protein